MANTEGQGSTLERVAVDLFNKLRTRFDDVKIGDEEAKTTQKPEDARVFNFDYVSSDDQNFGNITVSVSTERELKIYFSRNITEKLDDNQRQEWYGFLRGLRMFARRHLMNFDTRDITRDALELKQIGQDVSESRMYGKKRVSYQDIGRAHPVKIKINHSGEVDENVRGSRSRKVGAIFLETENGERLRLPFNNLTGARAMAQHVSHEGTLHDPVGKHISHLVAKAHAMRKFVSAVRNKTFEAEDVGEMTEAAKDEYKETVSKLKKMGGPKGYKSFLAEFEEEAPVEFNKAEMKEKFTRKLFDDRLEEAFPFVYQAYSKRKESKLNEKAPPGMEDVVMKLKKQYPGHEDKAFATAWAIYNKHKGKSKTESVNEYAPPAGNMLPPVPPTKSKGGDGPWEDDNRSNLLKQIKALLANGSTVTSKVPGFMGYIYRVEDDGFGMKPWNRPYSKKRYFVPFPNANRDSEFALKLVKPKQYDLVSASDLNESYTVADFRVDSFATPELFRKRITEGSNTLTRRVYSVYPFKSFIQVSKLLHEGITTNPQFIEDIKSLDMRDAVPISVGQSVAILSIYTLLMDKTIDVTGFTTPKTITKINLDVDSKIDTIEFGDGTQWPEALEQTIIGGISTVSTLFFPTKPAASAAYTKLWFTVSAQEGKGWRVRSTVQNTGINESIKVRDQVKYDGKTWLVAEIGDDNSVVLTPYLQSGPYTRQPGETIVEPENRGKIIREASMTKSIPPKKESEFSPGMQEIIKAGKGRVAILVKEYPHIVGFGEFLRVGQTGLVHIKLDRELPGWAAGDKIAVWPSEVRNPRIDTDVYPDNTPSYIKKKKAAQKPAQADLPMTEGEEDPYKRYPRAHFPKTKAENMRMKAKQRLEQRRLKKLLGSDTSGGESNIGSPQGGNTSSNDY